MAGREAFEGWFGDLIEECLGDFDAPAALAGGFEDFPAFPAEVAGCVDVDAEVDRAREGIVEGVEAFADDEVGGFDGAGAFALMGLEGPDGDERAVAVAEAGEVAGEGGEVGGFGEVALVVGDGVVVGEVVVGREDARGELRGECGLAGADGAGDGDDGAAGRAEWGGREGGRGETDGVRCDWEWNGPVVHNGP